MPDLHTQRRFLPRKSVEAVLELYFLGMLSYIRRFLYLIDLMGRGDRKL
jgi:hypothetical protein